MEHDFESDGPIRDGWRGSRCTQCGLRTRVPEEGTWKAAAGGPSHLEWRSTEVDGWISIENAKVPPCQGDVVT